MHYRSFGESAILINWHLEGENGIENEVFNDILSFYRQIQKEAPSWLEGQIPAADSLCVILRSSHDLELAEVDLRRIYQSLDSVQGEEKTWNIPVCYESCDDADHFAPDLNDVAAKCGVAEAEIVRLHSQKSYRVHFHGFLPGFVYLGGLDKTIHCDRKNHPRKIVRRGSVGIGGSQTGIYAIDSPGGWNIIGRTPVPVFDSSLEAPSPFNPGDRLHFHSISQSEYKEIESNIREERLKMGRWLL